MALKYSFLHNSISLYRKCLKTGLDFLPRFTERRGNPNDVVTSLTTFFDSRFYYKVVSGKVDSLMRKVENIQYTHRAFLSVLITYTTLNYTLNIIC